jgi:hypothetical protein
MARERDRRPPIPEDPYAPAPATQEKTELKPCAWCQSAAIPLVQTGATLSEWFLECRDCGACGPTRDNREAAIAAWNTRVPPAPLSPDDLQEAEQYATKYYPPRSFGWLNCFTDRLNAALGFRAL